MKLKKKCGKIKKNKEKICTFQNKALILHS